MSSVEVERQIGSGPKARDIPLARRPMGIRWLFWLPSAVLIVGLIATAVLTVLSRDVYERNQKHLLTLRARDAGAILTAAVPTIETPLASAAELADATGGNFARFKRFAMPYVGSGRTFESMSLWRLGALQRGPVAVLGTPLKLTKPMIGNGAFFSDPERLKQLGVIGLLSQPDPRIGYAYATPGSLGGYVAYAESPLPANHRSPISKTSTFTGLSYTLYLGRSQNAKDLLLTNVAHPPLTGQTASLSTAFGDQALTLVMASQGSLSGSLPEDLPWIIAIAGVLLTLGAATGTLRLTERRRNAEQLADALELAASENRRLYAEQRTIAQTLQHALLPDRLPQLEGLEASALYDAGERSVDIGGDWYDVIKLDDRQLLVVIGDVSGRGLKAATTMASLRYAIHAYVAQKDPPGVILSKLSDLVSVARDGQLATILCARIDMARREVTLTSAGHLPALLIAGGEASFVETKTGLPIGVEAGATYASTTISVPPRARLIGFTDGLVEQRGEDLDRGLERLRQAALAADGQLEEWLGKLVAELSGGDANDDIAIVGLQWKT